MASKSIERFNIEAGGTDVTDDRHTDEEMCRNRRNRLHRKSDSA